MLNYGMINDKAPHIIADLCEIACFFEDRPISRSDIEEFIVNKGGAGLLSQLEQDDESGAETNERMQRLTEDAFKHLEYRSVAFGSWYPFSVDHDVVELLPDQTCEHQIYVNLVCHSRLKMFEKSRQIRLAAEFEALCCYAMEGLFPSWNVYHFGAGGRDRAIFGNKLADAIKELASRLRDDLHSRHVGKISVHDTGDAGIDIVALLEWTDPAEAAPAYFAQCAAQQIVWPEKKFEAHPQSISKYINFFCDPGAILFIPICYRGPDGQWIDADGHRVILIDRLRIIELLRLQFARDSTLSAKVSLVFSAPFARGAYKPNDVSEAA